MTIAIMIYVLWLILGLVGYHQEKIGSIMGIIDLALFFIMIPFFPYLFHMLNLY